MEVSKLSFLNELIEVFLHNIIYYIPSELFDDSIFKQIEGEIEDSFFDELTLSDNFKGTAIIKNEDAFEVNQRLLEKKRLLEENVFKLLEKEKEFTPLEFGIAIERYFDQLMFYLHITEWFTINFKHCFKKEIHFSIVGAYKLQHKYFLSHLKDIYNYFGVYIDLEKEHNFTFEKMVYEHIPDLAARYNNIEKRIYENLEIEYEENQNNKDSDNTLNKVPSPQLKPKYKRKPKKKPQLSDEKVEKMILEGVFKLKIDY